jgi:drug/metabolite transporter (DMT)-like permease
VVAILGGFGAAVAWAISTLCSSRSSRMIEPASVVAWVALVGLVLLAPFLIGDGVPSNLDAGNGAWLLLSGLGNVVGLLLAYRAFRDGAVVLLAPLISTEGAIAALIAIAAGESMSAGTAVSLGVIAGGVALAAFHTGAGHPAAADSRRGIALAGLAAVSFGVGLYATGRVSGTLPLAWVVLPARAVGVAFVAVPLVLMRRLQLTRAAAPLVVASGVCEVLGYASFTLGARHDVAVTAVVGAQFAAIAALGAYVLFGERLTRTQVVGVVVLLAGVTALSGIRG